MNKKDKTSNTTQRKKTVNLNHPSSNTKSKASHRHGNNNNKQDEMPGDIKAFYKHPLVNGSSAENHHNIRKMMNSSDENSRDEVPGDLKAFFGHPLVNGEDTQASALALLHEYQNLPAIDRIDVRIGEKFDGLSDILRQENHNKSTTSNDGDYSVLLNSDVDAFLNRSHGSVSSATRELENSPQDFSNKSEVSNHSFSDNLPLTTMEDRGTPRSVRTGTPLSKTGAYHMYYGSENSPMPHIPLIRSPLSSPSKLGVDNTTILEHNNIADLSPSDSGGEHMDIEQIHSEMDTDASLLTSGLTPSVPAQQQYGSDSEQIVPDSIQSKPDYQPDQQVHQTVKDMSEKLVSVEAEVLQGKKKKGRTKSILAEALTSGAYTRPQNYETTSKKGQGDIVKPYNNNSNSDNDMKHVKNNNNKNLPPPPPYSSTSGFPLQGLNLPPISAICQQIQKEHPHIAAVPLALIEKSLMSLGFPTNMGNDAHKKNVGNTDKCLKQQSDSSSKVSIVGLTPTSLAPPVTSHNNNATTVLNIPTGNNCGTSVPKHNKELLSQNSKVPYSESITKPTAPKISQESHSHSIEHQRYLNSVMSSTAECKNEIHRSGYNNTTIYSHNTPGEPRKTVATQPQNLSIQKINTIDTSLSGEQKTNMSYPQFPFSTLEQLNIAPVPASPVITPTSQENLNIHKVTPVPAKQETSTIPTSLLPQMPDESQILSQLLKGAIFPAPGSGPVSHVIVPKSLFNMATQRMGIPVSYAKTSIASVVNTTASSAGSQVSGPSPTVDVSSYGHTHGTSNVVNMNSLKTSMHQTPVSTPITPSSTAVHPCVSFPTLTSHLLGYHAKPEAQLNAQDVVKDYSGKTMNKPPQVEQKSSGYIMNLEGYPGNSGKRPTFLPLTSADIHSNSSAASSVNNSPVCTPDINRQGYHHMVQQDDYHNKNPDSSSGGGRQSAPLFQHQMSVNDMFKNAYQQQQQQQNFLQKSSMSAPTTPVIATGVSLMPPNVYRASNNGQANPALTSVNVTGNEAIDNFDKGNAGGFTGEQLSQAAQHITYPSVVTKQAGNEQVQLKHIGNNIVTGIQQQYNPLSNTVDSQNKQKSLKNRGKRETATKTRMCQKSGLTPLSIVTTNLTPTISPAAVQHSTQFSSPPFRHPSHFPEISSSANGPHNGISHHGHHHHRLGDISPLVSCANQIEKHPFSNYSSNAHDSVTRSGTPSPLPHVVDKPSDSTKKLIQALTEKLQAAQDYHNTDGKAVCYRDINDLIKQTMQDHPKGCLPPPTDVDRYGNPTIGTSTKGSDIKDRLNHHNGIGDGLPISGYESVKEHESEASHSFTSSVESGELVMDIKNNYSHSVDNQSKQCVGEKQLESDRNHLYLKNASIPGNMDKNFSETVHINNTTEKDVSPCHSNVLVIKPQGGPSTPPLPPPPPQPPTHHHQGYPHELKSPDSGFNESCVSPSEASLHHIHNDHTFDGRSCTSSEAMLRDRVVKRRRSINTCVRSLQTHIPIGFPERRLSQSQSITKLDPARCVYRCYLDTPISASQKIDEDKITYLNKGQYYNLIIEYKAKHRPLPCSTVKSMVCAVFRDEKCVQDELRAWQFWHSRQHSVKHRIIDIDQKSSTGVTQIDEISHNAVTFNWKPQEQQATVSITINCLSTDFSNQKGVKGLPLHIQVDTFENESDPIPVHRAYCQIKVFCDKGAERKARDEERKKEAKTKQQEMARSKKKVEEVLHPSCDVSDFYDLADLVKQPVLFSPLSEQEDGSASKLGYNEMSVIQPQPVLPLSAPVSLPPPVYVPCLEEIEPVIPAKRSRTLSQENKPNEKVLLYVRERHEAVFTALLLLTPTMFGLVQAVEEKYGIPAVKIRNIYKRSHKGILVKMDDNIIRHYSNEATFIITIQRVETPGDHGDYYNITLMEIDSA